MFININRCKHYVVEKGDPDGLSLVFIHGFPFNHTLWNRQIDVLENYHTIAYDIRGFGKSRVGDGQYTIEMFSDDLLAIIKAFCKGPVVLIGSSMGGNIALRTIEKAAGRINGLVLCGTKTDAESDEGKIRRAQTVERIKKSGAKAFAIDALYSLFSAATKENRPEIIEELKKMMAATDPLALCGGTLAMAARTDTLGGLQQFHKPVLIITGEEDGISGSSYALTMADAATQSQVHIIPHAGHLVNIEQPQPFNDIFKDWLSDNFPR